MPCQLIQGRNWKRKEDYFMWPLPVPSIGYGLLMQIPGIVLEISPRMTQAGLLKSYPRNVLTGHLPGETCEITKPAIGIRLIKQKIISENSKRAGISLLPKSLLILQHLPLK